MAVTHPTTIRNGIADYVVDLLDVGSTNAAGQIVLQTAGDVEVATLAMSNPAFGAAAAGVATANSITDDSSATGGTTTKGELQDRNESAVVDFSVSATGGGGDLELSSTTIGAGDTVQISSMTYTAPN